MKKHRDEDNKKLVAYQDQTIKIDIESANQCISFLQKCIQETNEVIAQFRRADQRSATSITTNQSIASGSGVQQNIDDLNSPSGLADTVPLGGPLSDSLGDPLSDSLGGPLGNALGGSLVDSLGGSLGGSVGGPLDNSLGGSLGTSVNTTLRVSQSAILESEDLADPETLDSDIVDPQNIFPGDENFFTADGLDCEADIILETFPESEENSNGEDIYDDNDPSGMVSELGPLQR
ncbi:hypothetical protein BDZ94DRAFT_1311346 [Collybia nuda]|uniref:Uncharacterized protein n=1 Tax=Collybia nuda TaxID=64659 RepID=A0A9P5XZF9_9AGAR|nr:hypothetical protein BDZ94DRAFT_1311346 [Collybia nuda]